MDRSAVTCPVIEVGPAMVRGPGPVDTELADAALEFIDDPVALLGDDRLEPVARLWRTVLRSAAGSPSSKLPAVHLVCPAWWPPAWVRRVAEAAPEVGGDVVVQRRAVLLAARFRSRPAAVVEIAPQFLTVWAGGRTVDVVHRHDEVAAVVESVAAVVLAGVGAETTVLVDPPAGVPGARALSRSVSEALRRQGLSVTVVQPDWLWEQRPDHPSAGNDRAPGRGRPRRGGHLRAAVIGAAVTAVVVLLAVLTSERAGHPTTQPDHPPDTAATTLLVEGRVGVLVPALWRPQRITAGPGSARVQVVSPSEEHAALHITQSPLPAHHTRELVAEVLDAALRDQPADVFVDFNPVDDRAGRPAVTYREIRATHHIDWAVLIDRQVRIAIGCQHPVHDPVSTRPVCEQAIRSAHAIS